MSALFLFIFMDNFLFIIIKYNELEADNKVQNLIYNYFLQSGYIHRQK